MGWTGVVENVHLVPPGAACADARPTPPAIKVRVVATGSLCVVNHGTKATKEMSIHKLPGAFPLEVLIVQGIIPVQFVQVVGQFGSRPKVIHMDVRLVRRRPFVVIRVGSHHYWHYLVPVNTEWDTKFVKVHIYHLEIHPA